MAYSETVYWLTLINESGLKLNLVKSVIQRWSVLEKRAVADLFDLSPLEWSTTFGLTDNEAERVAAAMNEDRLAQQAKMLAQWQAQGLEPVIRTNPRYPQRLAQTLPPASQPLLLWGQGNLTLFNEPAVTVLGEQSPDEAGAEFVDELMQVLVSEEIGLVSGYGRGLDRVTFERMLATEGGHAVALIPMGLSAFAQTTTKLEAALQAGKIALASPFAPDAAFQEKFAEARHLLIDYLALVLLVLDTSEDAQTRAMAALERGLPVLVRPADTAANRSLIDRGALLLTDTGEVVEMAQQAMIDDTMREQAAEEVIPMAPPMAAPLVPPDSDDDYALRPEEIEPIASDEALEILSMGGEVPDILRKRLKKEKKPPE
ncbi:MAG: DNA-processing protein DprA [Anaerolineae bacterium]|nr:DNA-processing protein DprA [Anaerolineae bacterium]